MPPRKPLASVSLDADDLWSYQRTHGDAGWVERRSYLPLFFPRVLEQLDRLGLRITFFLVGHDAARPEQQDLFRELTRRGHEVGNHTFEHECWLHRFTRERLEAEVDQAESAIARATGQRPTGFRGPGFSWSPLLFDVLERRGYRYDASTLPTFIGPLARWYFLRSSGLEGEERRQREALFGGFSDGFRPNRPYRWQLEGGRTLLEIPVTTMPGTRLPFHMSYLLYLGQRSAGLMRAYLATALAACRVSGVEPSFLLHPLDLLSGEEVPELRFFPGMNLPRERKTELFGEVLEALAARFEVVPMGQHADRAVAREPLPLREPVLST